MIKECYSWKNHATMNEKVDSQKRLQQAIIGIKNRMGEERHPEGHELRGGCNRQGTKRADRRTPEMKKYFLSFYP